MTQRLTAGERNILAEAELVLGRTLKSKDLAEWSTSESVIDKNITEDEEKVECKNHGVWCAIVKAKPRAKRTTKVEG